MKRELVGAEETEAVGAALARVVAGQGGVLALRGDLGAGKTTLVRGLLHALGHAGAVRSPTYTLVEPYLLHGTRVLHIDLYRIAAPDELEGLGLRDELDGDALVIVEWPERAGAALPPPDVELLLEHHGNHRLLSGTAGSSLGERCLQAIEIAR